MLYIGTRYNHARLRLYVRRVPIYTRCTRTYYVLSIRIIIRIYVFYMYLNMNLNIYIRTYMYLHTKLYVPEQKNARTVTRMSDLQYLYLYTSNRIGTIHIYIIILPMAYIIMIRYARI